MRIGVRVRLLLAVVGAVGFALVVGVTAFNVLLDQRVSSSATSLAQAQADAELGELHIENGALTHREGPDEGAPDGQVWVITNGRFLEAPRARAALDDAALSLASGPRRSLDVDDTRLYAIPVEQGGRRYGTVVSAVSLDAYRETRRTALAGSLILAVLLLGSVAAVTWWMLGRALRPVAQMTEAAATWSESDLDRRFDLGEPYDELTRLAATLDGLLERIAASMRHEQRFTAELSHELRTPLARISAEAELMLGRERSGEEYRAALLAMGRNAAQMTRTMDALLTAARQEAGGVQATSDVRVAVEAAVGSARESTRDLQIRLTLPDGPVLVDIDEQLVERIVEPLVSNAVTYGRGHVDVSLALNGPAAVVYVADDGPGVDDSERALIFEPGTRGAAAAAGHPGGAGLGLALAQRLARSAGGEITVLPSRTGGRFALRIPLSR